MPIFMKAGSIQGDVVAASHKGWVQVESCGFSVTFDEDDVRKSLSEGAPLPDLGTFDVGKKSADQAGPSLMQWMVDGKKMPEVQFDVCGDALANGSWRCTVRYVLKGVEMTDYSINMSDAEKGESAITMKLSYDEMRLEQFSYEGGNMTRTAAKPVSLKKPG